MTSELSDQNLTSPDYAEVLVTKRRNRRPDKARDGTPHKATVWCGEEADRAQHRQGE